MRFKYCKLNAQVKKKTSKFPDLIPLEFSFEKLQLVESCNTLLTKISKLIHSYFNYHNLEHVGKCYHIHKNTVYKT